jgi:uncharacterized protein YkwD
MVRYTVVYDDGARMSLLIAALLAQDVDALCRALEAEADAPAAERLVAKLHALWTAAEAPARDGLRARAVAAVRARRDRVFREVEARAKALLPLRARREELQRRRDAALKAIGDPKLYLPEAAPDFKKGDEANGQKAVDDLVRAVRELWDEAPEDRDALDPALRDEARAAADAAAKALALFGETDPEPPLLHNLGPHPITIRTFALNAKDVELLAWNRRVARYNEGLNDPDVGATEKEGAAVLNAYREMMGRRALFLDARLCRSSKKHSAACNAAQKIWHAGADGDPQTRARLEAFPLPVAENVAIAFPHPTDVWTRGWFRASDHHRNGISETWTCLGYGYVGNVGTQTFSTLPPPKALKP